MSRYPSLPIQLRGFRNLFSLKRSFRNGFRTAPRPFLAVWESTDRCNSRCRYCASWHSSPVPESELLGTGEMISLLDQLMQIGTFGLVITGGGEPLLRPDIGTVIREAKQRNFYVAVTTNGTLITPENVDALLPADLVTVSIDSVNPAVYQLRHGIPRAADALRGLELISEKRRRPYLTVQAVIDEENWDTITRLNSYFHPKGIDTVFQLRYGQRFSIPQSKWKAMVDRLRFHSRFTRGLFLPFLSHFPAIARGGDSVPCFALSSHLVISPTGELRICNHRAEIIAHLRKHPLYKIWPELRELRREIAGPGRGCACGNSCYIPPAFLITGHGGRPGKGPER